MNAQLQKNFQEQGILHQLNCPHTPEQLGIVERRHHVVVELGLAQLFNSGVSSRLWVESLLESFSTPIHILNRLPSTSLPVNKSPFWMVYNKTPLYSSFRVFGCMCFPYLKMYVSNKFDPKSAPCIFFGYIIHHKVYKCFNPENGHTYYSTHEVFDEESFPAKDVTQLKRSVSSSLILTSLIDYLPQVALQ